MEITIKIDGHNCLFWTLARKFNVSRFCFSRCMASATPKLECCRAVPKNLYMRAFKLSVKNFKNISQTTQSLSGTRELTGKMLNAGDKG